MVFTAISKQADTYVEGNFISPDRYEIFEGVKIYFYDKESVTAEFSDAGLYEVAEIDESYPFFLIKCRKTANK
ncbi:MULTISPECIES: hypothetical protein [unclassified Mucilaginibacter]|uniref:hypothetical protein n=1 Tax=unclassified Mucilaginibacter TaxID=2617802 RepID=UPI002AC9C544|nr:MULTISPECIES: hypothetical protein [unclassified Mucilaginibacter]MEB0260822.1 hypothetical protein [Mucilaginibacter sp. 10I4]MEB0279037.1 hypothetical protein [Mucilaginibacter sp. 10B2]MEB0299944.1 hypothetical protein [Mucilaginibacter sp. 5C4]WPX22215.1 hypothetical protein RHM67_13080 [Mucilaginibacter sp. 5C4]